MKETPRRRVYKTFTFMRGESSSRDEEKKKLIRADAHEGRGTLRIKLRTLYVYINEFSLVYVLQNAVELI